MNEILKQFTPNNVAGGSYERISIASLTIGYYTSGNSSMAQSAPTNKIDLTFAAPRVMFVVA